MTTGTTTSHVKTRAVVLGRKSTKKKKRKPMSKINITKELTQSITESQKDMLTLSILKLNGKLDEKALEEEFAPIVSELQEELAEDDKEFTVDWKEVLSELDSTESKYSELFEQMTSVLTKIEGIEESVVTESVNLIAQTIQYSSKGIYEQFEAETDAKADELAEAKTKDLEESIDSKYKEALNEWVEKHKDSIEAGKRVAQADALLEGLKTLFAENKVETDTDEAELIETLRTEKAELETQLAEAKSKVDNLAAAQLAEDKEKVFDSVLEGSTDVEKEKMKAIAESIVFIDLDQYKEKLVDLKEMFKSPGKVDEIAEGQPTGTQVDEEAEEAINEEVNNVYNRVFSFK